MASPLGQYVYPRACDNIKFTRFQVPKSSEAAGKILTAQAGTQAINLKNGGLTVINIGLAGFTTEYFTLDPGQTILLPYNGSDIYARNSVDANTYLEIIEFYIV